MKFTKKLGLILGFIIFIPSLTHASKLVDIKEIRGDKNHYMDFLFNNTEMICDKNDLQGKSRENSQEKSEDNKRWEGDILKELSGKSFSFYSGLGAWMTNLTFTDGKGNFEASFSDSDIDQVQGAECVGKFDLVERIDDTSYKLKLSNVKTTSQIGESYVNGKLNIGKKVPYGFESSENPDEYSTSFTLYLPKRLKSQIDENVYAWAYNVTDHAYIDDYQSRIFILANDSTKAGFAENIN